MEQIKISRINQLSRKSKRKGLTNEEKLEQQQLRNEYLADMRGSLKSTLEKVTVVEPDGSYTNLNKNH